MTILWILIFTENFKNWLDFQHHQLKKIIINTREGSLQMLSLSKELKMFGGGSGQCSPCKG